MALLLLPLTLPASASPADDARSRATAIARQRQQITVEAERVNERRLATVLELDQLNRNAEELQVTLAVTDQSVQNLSGQAKDAAIQAYVTGTDSSGIASVVQATSANETPSGRAIPVHYSVRPRMSSIRSVPLGRIRNRPGVNSRPSSTRRTAFRRHSTPIRSGSPKPKHNWPI